MAKMVGRSKSFLLWLLGFIFTFFLGTNAGKAQKPQMKYGIIPRPDLIKPLDGVMQPKYGVAIQPKYGVMPNPGFVGKDLVNLSQKEVTELIGKYKADKGSSAQKKATVKRLTELRSIALPQLRSDTKTSKKKIAKLRAEHKKLKQKGASAKSLVPIEKKIKSEYVIQRRLLKLMKVLETKASPKVEP